MGEVRILVDPEEWVGGNEGEPWDGKQGVYLGDWPDRNRYPVFE